MSTADLIYQEAQTLSETAAQEVLDFIGFLKIKHQKTVSALVNTDTTELDDELDQFGIVFDGQFDREACYDRPLLR